MVPCQPSLVEGLWMAVIGGLVGGFAERAMVSFESLWIVRFMKRKCKGVA